MRTFGERLTDIMLVTGFTPSRLAARIGVSVVAVRQWMREEDCKMSAKHLIALAETFNVRALWLCNGSGDIARARPAAYTEADLIRLYRILGQTARMTLSDIAAVLAKRDGGK